MATTQQQVPDSNASSGIDSEKQSIQYVEDRDMKNELEETGYIRTYADIDEGFDPKEVRRIVRKVDLHLIPILAAMYCISLIDRTNLSMARSANGKLMNKELSLDQGNYYSVATMVSGTLPLPDPDIDLFPDFLYSLHHPGDPVPARTQEVRRALVARDRGHPVGYRHDVHGFRQDAAAAHCHSCPARYL